MLISVLLIALLCSSRCGSQVGASSNEPANGNKAEHTTYGVIVDCGSSGTRANIYDWDSRLDNAQLLHDVEPMRDSRGKPVTKKIKPGLTSVADNPETASDYMKPLIEFISDKIPGESLSSAGIYILCTAGMRLLSSESQHSILEDIVVDLKSNYNFAKVETSVISGAREGIYQWIAVNSRLKAFDSNKPSSTYAVMEMGGASAQITYQVDPGIHKTVLKALAKTPEARDSYKKHIVKPEMSRDNKKQVIKIFSSSFLGFGSNSAREAYVDLLIMLNKRHRFQKDSHDRVARFNNSGKETLYLSDPCLPSGSMQRMKKPKRMLENRQKTLGFIADDDEPTFEVRLVGKGKFLRCRMLLHAMLQVAKRERLNCKTDEPCAMTLLGSPFVPYQRIKIKGLSEFFYTTKEMMNLEGTYDRNRVTQLTKDICATTYDKLLKKYSEANKHDPSRVLLECFKAVWIDVFLTDGTMMSADNRSLQTIGKINGEGIDWTLGAILDKSLAIEKATEVAQSNYKI